MADRPLPSVDVLRQLLLYDAETGALTWVARPVEMFSDVNGRTAGNCCAVWNAKYAEKEAGYICKIHGYRYCKLLWRRFPAHQIAWAMHTGDWAEEIDHINGVRSDNRIVNLRSVTRTENARNCKIRSDNKSGASGVDMLPSKRWRVSIRLQGKRKHLGVFDELSDALIARKAAETRFGFHPNHGREA